jgi:L-fuculose-phosphate aldolase
MPKDDHKSKEDFDAVATQQMNRHLVTTDEWTLKEKLALSCRILDRQDQGSALAGHVTARGPEPETCWTVRFGLGLDEVTPDDYLLVDNELNVLEGEGMPSPAARFHLWVFRRRPDVMASIHTHAPYTSALSMIGVPLKPSHMDTSLFYDDCEYLAHWPGPPIGDEEGDIISAALGDKRSILLAHHGYLAACSTLEETLVLAYYFEHAARLQLLAMSAGTIQDLDPTAAQDAHDYRLKPAPIAATFHYFARRVLRDDPGCLG